MTTTISKYYSSPIFSDERYEPWLDSPDTLLNLAGNVVDNLPLPECWTWSIADVVKWLRYTVQLPQYKECFIDNLITGRRLILVDASVCPKIGIRDFSHIQRVTEEIRKLFRIEKEKPDRSISLPPRYPWTHYLLYSVRTGPKHENIKPTELFRMMGIIDEGKPCPFGHWEMIESTYPDFPCNRFSLVKRKNVHRREEYTRMPRGHSYYKRSSFKPNYFLRIDIK